MHWLFQAIVIFEIELFALKHGKFYAKLENFQILKM